VLGLVRRERERERVRGSLYRANSLSLLLSSEIP
jgi:hypothetical protein